MILSQRYPTVFNGIVSGDPAMRTGLSNLAIAQWIPVAYNQAAPKDASGKPQIDKFLTDDDRKLFMDALMKQCDAKDGVADGMISDPLGCDFDPAVLACKPGQSDACIAPEKTTAIKKAFAGPKNAYGTQVYPGFLYDAGIAAKGFASGLLALGPNGLFGPYTTATELDVDKAALHASDPLVEPASTNLSTFSLSGGKLIFFHGDSDPWFSPLDTLGYYQSLAATNGGAEKVLPMEPYVSGARDGPLRRRPLSRSLRHAHCRRQLGRERHCARRRYRYRSGIPRSQPTAVRLSKTRAVHRNRRHPGCPQLPMPIATLDRRERFEFMLHRSVRID